MATLDKEIKVLALKGETGNSSYQDAVENELFSGTLEEFIETFATPENYITRYEYKKVTQAEYDALEQSGQLIPNCYYFITDDDTWETIQNALSLAGDVETLQDDVSGLQDDVSSINDSLETISTNLGTAQGDIADLQEEVAPLSQAVSDMQSDILHLQTKTSIPTILNCPTTSENKVVTETNFPVPIAEGTEIYVKFAQYGSLDTWHIMTLNVNDTGALPIYVLGAVITNNDSAVWSSGDIVRLVCQYIGTGYVWNVQENVTKHKYCGTLYTR